MNVGLLTMPAFTDAGWADGLANTGNGFQVTQWSENKEVAGAFLAFLQEPENLQALYEATGNVPDLDELGLLPGVERDRPTDARLARAEQLDLVERQLHPGRPRRQRPFVVFQKMMAGEIDVERGAADLPGRAREMAQGESGRGRELPVVAQRLGR